MFEDNLQFNLVQSSDLVSTVWTHFRASLSWIRKFSKLISFRRISVTERFLPGSEFSRIWNSEESSPKSTERIWTIWKKFRKVYQVKRRAYLRLSDVSDFLQFNFDFKWFKQISVWLQIWVKSLRLQHLKTLTQNFDFKRLTWRLFECEQLDIIRSCQLVTISSSQRITPNPSALEVSAKMVPRCCRDGVEMVQVKEC